MCVFRFPFRIPRHFFGQVLVVPSLSRQPRKIFATCIPVPHGSKDPNTLNTIAWCWQSDRSSKRKKVLIVCTFSRLYFQSNSSECQFRLSTASVVKCRRWTDTDERNKKKINVGIATTHVQPSIIWIFETHDAHLKAIGIELFNP